MSAAAGATGPTPQERLWATDPTTPAVVLAKLATFPELRSLVREHPNVYPDLIEWIDAQPAVDEGAAEGEAAAADAAAADAASAAASARTGKRVLIIAASVAVLTIVGAAVMIGVVQPWAPRPGSGSPAAGEALEATPTPTASPTPTETPTPTPEPVQYVPVEGTVVPRAGANVRAEPNTQSAKIGAYNVNAKVVITCFVHGETISDALGTTDIWYLVGNGFMSGAIVQPSGSVMPC